MLQQSRASAQLRSQLLCEAPEWLFAARDEHQVYPKACKLRRKLGANALAGASHDSPRAEAMGEGTHRAVVSQRLCSSY